MLSKISVTILTKNSSKTLKACLEALVEFDEVIVLDNGSSDKTIEIAQNFENVKVYTSEFIGFGPLKNLASQYATNDWIFSLDSDEILSNELCDSIKNLDLEENTVYAIDRLNHYNGKVITCCGWSPDTVQRIYNKQKTSFSDVQVHESLIVKDMRQMKVDGKLLHYSFDSIEGLLEKLQRYSTLWAEQNRLKKNSSYTRALIHSSFAMLKNFIWQKGFLSGKEGFLISICNALGVFFKYAKLAEKNAKISTSLIITTYNRPDALELVLLSVFAQNVLPDEIIIADDGSGEQTQRLIEKMQAVSPVPLLHAWQEDDGFRAAASRNNGLRMATSEYIILIDGDMVLEKSFIQDHIAVAKKNQFIQGGRVLLDKNKTLESLLKQLIDFGFFDFGILNRHNALHFPLTISLQNPYKGIRTCNMAFWLEDIQMVNGFDEQFIGWGREDSEFSARLINSGLQRKNLKFGAIAYHLWHSESSREALGSNDDILDATLSQNKTWCEKGLKQ